MLPSREAIVEQVVRIIGIRLLDPLEILLDGDGAVEAVRTIVGARAAAWAATIRDAEDAAAIGLILRIVATLYPSDGLFEPPLDWWRTPLGRVVAQRVGHPTAPAVPYSVAGAMLGITRQGVHDLVSRGKLIRHPDGGVVPTSVRDRLREGNRN